VAKCDGSVLTLLRIENDFLLAKALGGTIQAGVRAILGEVAI
jgi:hypothetical protein